MLAFKDWHSNKLLIISPEKCNTRHETEDGTFAPPGATGVFTRREDRCALVFLMVA